MLVDQLRESGTETVGKDDDFRRLGIEGVGVHLEEVDVVEDGLLVPVEVIAQALHDLVHIDAEGYDFQVVGVGICVHLLEEVSHPLLIPLGGAEDVPPQGSLVLHTSQHLWEWYSIQCVDVPGVHCQRTRP
jgi:hypothetical protein